MEIYKLSIFATALIIVIATYCGAGHAQNPSVLPTLGNVEVCTAEGFYEYNKDGVPVLGIITQA
jgi:hypothetical protein